MLNWKSFKWIGLLLTIVMSDDLYILDLLDKSRSVVPGRRYIPVR